VKGMVAPTPLQPRRDARKESRRPTWRRETAARSVCGRFAKCSFVLEPHGDLEKVGGQSRGLDSELKENAISSAECGAL
jgi:hypothetical protein